MKEVNKIAMITGATSGIGKATAKLFAKRGYNLILTGRRADRLEALKDRYEKKYVVSVATLNFDVRNQATTAKAYNSLGPEWHEIDVLVNNAGLARGFGSIHEGDLEDWETMIDTNLKGLLFITRLVTPGMVSRRKGFVINICSIAGHEVYPNGNVYCATKHAVDALTKGMRLDLHQHNIRVGQVSPAHVEETEFALVRYDGDSEKSKIYEDFNPLRSKDVAEVIYFMVNQPYHVNIHDVIMSGTQQASATQIDRTGRRFDKTV